MASVIEQMFDGSTGFTDAHDNIQTKDGNVTWLNEFAPSVESSEKRIAEFLLWAFHTLGLCCTIAGEYAMYRSGKLISRLNSIFIFIASHPQKWS